MQQDLVHAEEPKAKRAKRASTASQRPHTPASVKDLSDEVTSLVLSFLPMKDHLVSLPVVCFRFRILMRHTLAWPPTLSFVGALVAPCKVSDHLYKFSHLRFTDADLQGVNISDTALRHLARMPLQTLYLDSILDVTDSGPWTWFGVNDEIPGPWTGVTNAGLAHLALARLPLQCLSIKYCNKITSQGLAFLVDLPLKRLVLDFCNCTDEVLALLTTLPLEDLSLKRGTNITDAGLAHLSDLNLYTLNLSGCTSITNAGLVHLARMPLQRLSLNYCEHITDTGLMHLAVLPLHKLGLFGCRNVTAAGHAHISDLVSKNQAIEYDGVMFLAHYTNLSDFGVWEWTI
jgi:hypothetical protein